ncbi:MAG: nucleotidyltransferase substrate binding protein [Candidatus Binatia bacterium]
MARLKERLDMAESALRSFEEVVGQAGLSALERDAAILRSQYSFEAVWKAAQVSLREREGTEAASPKQVVRACLSTGILDAEAARDALALVDDRNLTVHTYNEPLALALVARLADHAALLRVWLDRLRS